MTEIAPAGPGFIKRLNERLRGDRDAMRQWRAEIAILDALAGRGAPRLLASGEDASGPWLQMTEVAWPTLYTHLDTLPDPAWVARAAQASFAALAAVHEAGDGEGSLAIVHGDVSPANVAVAADGASAALLDFGLATGRHWPTPTGGAFRGTILYAAPEIARAEPFDARADLFALAASLLHVASGVAPRGAPSLAAAIAEAAETPLASWAKRAAAPLPAATAAALEACIAFDASERPASAREVTRLLVEGGP